ncbi:hypothetical protein RF55_13473 [Lasius niger]|uniref:Uncharacterized protein n=1 Tax=Lasius niger TaxID=67767 RepID=A0A0J7KAI1_LASNI|nr:hypothetical protein RF55_13473 [Lasius niger]
MSAFEADKWARHLVKALAEAGEKINTTEMNFGIGELIKRDIRNPLVEPTKILEADIEDPMTLTYLRNKVFELHVDFLKAAASQIFPLVAAITQGKDIMPRKAV